MKKIGANGLPDPVAGITTTLRPIFRPCWSAGFSGTSSVPHFPAMTMPLVPVTLHAIMGSPRRAKARGPLAAEEFDPQADKTSSKAPATTAEAVLARAGAITPP